MRSVSAPLIAAAKAPAALPYVEVQLRDRYLGVPNLRWDRWYTGSEAEGPCLCAVPSDGSLVRARIDPGGGRLYLNRVASPNAGSTYSSWTNHDAASATPRLGLSAHTSRVLAAWYDGANIRFSDSSDSGATWSAAATAALVGAGVTAITCAMRLSDGTAAILYAVGTTVYAMTRSGTGAWGAATGWSVTSFASINGLSAMATADYDIVVSGALTAGLGSHSVVYAYRLGAGVVVSSGTWTAATEVSTASASTGVTLRTLSMNVCVTPRIQLHEEYSGGLYGPTQSSSGLADSDFDPPLPADPRALDYSQQYGLGFAASSTRAFWTSARGVWSAAVPTTTYDLTEDVLSLEYSQDTTNVGRLRLTLRDEDGRYADSGATPPLHPLAELTVSPGYVTTSGALASLGPKYFVERVTRRRADGRAVAIVEATDAFGALATWRAPRQFAWAASSTTASLIAAFIAQRAGVDASTNWSTEASVNYSPAFTVPAGETALSAIRRLVADLPDELVPDLDRVVAIEPLTTDTSGYSYGTDHPIEELELTRERSRLGWARVVGPSIRSERTDATELWRGGPAVVEVDKNLSVQARADARAATLFRQAANETARGYALARPFAGLEVGDAIDITDAQLGLISAKFRVRALRLRYDTGRAPKYDLRAELGDL